MWQDYAAQALSFLACAKNDGTILFCMGKTGSSNLSEILLKNVRHGHVDFSGYVVGKLPHCFFLIEGN